MIVTFFKKSSNARQATAAIHFWEAEKTVAMEREKLWAENWEGENRLFPLPGVTKSKVPPNDQTLPMHGSGRPCCRRGNERGDLTYQACSWLWYIINVIKRDTWKNVACINPNRGPPEVKLCRPFSYPLFICPHLFSYEKSDYRPQTQL